MSRLLYSVEDILAGRIKLNLHPDYKGEIEEIINVMMKEMNFPKRVLVKDVEYKAVVNSKADKLEWESRIERAIQNRQIDESSSEMDIIDFVCNQEDITNVTTQLLSDPDDFRGLVQYEDDEVFASILADALEDKDTLIEAFKVIEGEEKIIEMAAQNSDSYCYDFNIDDIDIQYKSIDISLEEFVEKYRNRISNLTIQNFIEEGEFWKLLIENQHVKFEIRIE
ncbi:hypothetical protein NAC36_002429 [Staphylococcus pseudintermedius]|uniref:hypothetical protein n=1 Tax=Staphylococcus pseudintermedius TaxID=283734 RepID=UPI000BBC64C1|nr:hypothetical protein [Staphylococcus pseudintermedius]EGQ2789529.1 hypothetical protein [Staphylococcus pseudintermedius]EGQ2899969.1 hypothetical protein [Staphylococcus pseudintermedius]EGQ3075942.1 hypothetical protein [Staphylococcus pseudintermedius]EGQ3318393.1 hypothetical protein [Staphylococcus pseudintermedius]EGQ3374958.1 hypothetical protein [Staphylococcus pseudintermedius]